MKNTLEIKTKIFFILLGILALFTFFIMGSRKYNDITPLTFPETKVFNFNTPPDIEDVLATPQAASVAFPGAEGFGAATQGGRYGKVIIVTNLNDTTDTENPDYPGSLRWALEHTWPDTLADPYDQRRIIVFQIGGTIRLVDTLTIKHPHVTIAAQTAPGDGIVLRGDGLAIITHDVIVRGLRVRVGDEGSPTCCRDGIRISTSGANSDVYNVIIDHSSVSWGIDENLSTWVNDSKPYNVHNITIQWSVISEALDNSIHVDEGSEVTAPHSMGVLLGKSGYNISFHHNLLSQNRSRNPRIDGISNMEFINNVIYGWGTVPFEFSNEASTTHILNNYFRANSASSNSEILIHTSMNPASKIFMDGNLSDDIRVNEKALPVRVSNTVSFQFARGPLFTPSGINTTSAVKAYADVLDFAGASCPVRDEVDTRIIGDVRMMSGKIIDSQNQVGGWPTYRNAAHQADADQDGIPDAWEVAHNLDPANPDDASNDKWLTQSGYTWIEEYVNSLIPLLCAQ